MRVGDNLPNTFQSAAAVLWMLGIVLNVVLAISPAWGWDRFLGWGASTVLAVLAWSERRGIQAGLRAGAPRVSRWLAFTLLISTVAALSANLACAIALPR